MNCDARASCICVESKAHRSTVQARLAHSLGGNLLCVDVGFTNELDVVHLDVQGLVDV